MQQLAIYLANKLIAWVFKRNSGYSFAVMVTENKDVVMFQQHDSFAETTLIPKGRVNTVLNDIHTMVGTDSKKIQTRSYRVDNG